MSKTAEVKEIIMEYLSDGKVHEVAEIKKYIMDRYRNALTEGVIAGSFRTMTTDGIIEKVERGKYRLSTDNCGVNSGNSDDKSVCYRILELTEIYEAEAISVINSIEVKEENMEDLKKGMKLRKKIEKLCEELKKELN